jgi:transposase
MGARRRRFSREFKLEAVRMVQQNPNEAVSQIARKLGVRREMLNRWCHEAEQGKHEAEIPQARPGNEAAEVEQLRRELERVKQERDFLKKAAAYFAQEPK